MKIDKKYIASIILVYVFLLVFVFSSCINRETADGISGSGSESFYGESNQTSEGVLVSDIDSEFTEISEGQTSSGSQTTSSGENRIQNSNNTSTQSKANKNSSESRGNDVSKPTESSKPSESSKSEESKPTPINNSYLRGIWVSQYDMSSVYVSGGVQRGKSSYISMVEKIVSNIKKDGFNTVFLQMRPFGDSFYNSAYYPLSRFVAGNYGGSISYDPIEIFIAKANAVGLSIQGWINPMRLMMKSEIASVPDNYPVKKWYNDGSDRIVEVDGRLYLNPAYPEARQLIMDGAAEILKKYNVDGIHIDDYFYPTKNASFDSASYAKSGYSSLQTFRENNINLMVSGLYKTVHNTDSKAVFGVSPAGNLDDLRSVYFIDVKKWCSEDGYLDYIIPQLYYGFLHGVCPFDKMVDKWAAIVTNPKIKYYVGMSGGNAYNAYSGSICVWAVTEAGKNEWINNKDVLGRSFEYIFSKNTVNGYCFFCYQYLYSPTTGNATPDLAEEYTNFINVIKQ